MDLPSPLPGDPLQGGAGIHDMRPTDLLEEREVMNAVGVEGAVQDGKTVIPDKFQDPALLSVLESRNAVETTGTQTLPEHQRVGDDIVYTEEFRQRLHDDIHRGGGQNHFSP